MIDEYLGELSSQLAAVGVRGAAARRLLREARDHLEESAGERGEVEAASAFGPARDLARHLAAELATARTRSAAVAAFLALGVGGAVYAALFLSLGHAGRPPDIAGGSVPGLGFPAMLGIVFFPQLAFVSGCLALVRVVRLRGRAAQSAAELRVQRWRTGVALAAGMLTFGSFLIVALDFRRDLAPWWVVSAVGACAGVVALLVAVAVAGVRAAQPRSLVEGAAEHVLDDVADLISHIPGLRRAQVPGDSRRLALVVAAAAAAGVALAGVLGADPLDGLLRAVAEGIAVLGCYATLGRGLGLRP